MSEGPSTPEPFGPHSSPPAKATGTFATLAAILIIAFGLILLFPGGFCMLVAFDRWPANFSALGLGLAICAFGVLLIWAGARLLRR